MGLVEYLLILVFVSGFTRSLGLHAWNQTDIEAATEDMRSKSYYGFAMILKMLNGTSQPNQEVTFFMPDDRELSAGSIAADRIEEFLMSHAMPMPLYFSDLIHFPTGTMVPSGIRNKTIRVHNRGRGDFYLNNAQITASNICLSSMIKCHAIDAIINYDS